MFALLLLIPAVMGAGAYSVHAPVAAEDEKRRTQGKPPMAPAERAARMAGVIGIGTAGFFLGTGTGLVGGAAVGAGIGGAVGGLAGPVGSLAGAAGGAALLGGFAAGPAAVAGAAKASQQAFRSMFGG